MDTGERTSSKNAGRAVPTPTDCPTPAGPAITLKIVPPVPTLSSLITVVIPLT